MTGRLKELGIYDSTLIILTSDHGASFRAGSVRRALGEENQSDIVSVPLIVKLPGQELGVISDKTVESVDILPAVASALSVDLPFVIDGRSPFDDSLVERESHTFIDRSYERVNPIELHEIDQGVQRSLKRKVDRFGSRSEDGLYSLPDTAALIGREVSGLVDTLETKATMGRMKSRRFASVDLEARDLPLFVSNVLETGGSESLRLAVSINGRVAATTRSYQEDGEWVFGTVVPERFLRSGANEVGVFVIEAKGEDLVLRPVREVKR
jgi:hypothetical protein